MRSHRNMLCLVLFFILLLGLSPALAKPGSTGEMPKGSEYQANAPYGMSVLSDLLNVLRVGTYRADIEAALGTPDSILPSGAIVYDSHEIFKNVTFTFYDNEEIKTATIPLLTEYEKEVFYGDFEYVYHHVCYYAGRDPDNVEIQRYGFDDVSSDVRDVARYVNSFARADVSWGDPSARGITLSAKVDSEGGYTIAILINEYFAEKSS